MKALKDMNGAELRAGINAKTDMLELDIAAEDWTSAGANAAAVMTFAVELRSRELVYGERVA